MILISGPQFIFVDYANNVAQTLHKHFVSVGYATNAILP